MPCNCFPGAVSAVVVRRVSAGRVSAGTCSSLPCRSAFVHAVAYMWVLPRAGLDCWVVIVSSDNKKKCIFFDTV